MPGELEIDSIKALVNQWLDIDVNETTRNQIKGLSENIELNYDELNNMLSQRIVFGTAGLRAKMEAGFSRMNDVTVLQASQGLAEYILKANQHSSTKSIVIGHDHRHNSKRFAELTIACFLLKGFKVYYIGPNDCATPMVPFAIDYFNSLGGIMITASHNPKADNGYKVYWSNGCQIIPPNDINIQREILLNLTPILDSSDNWNTDKIFQEYQQNLIYCFTKIVNEYNKHLLKILNPNSLSNFKIVYTAMHGVGYKFVSQLIDNFISNKQNFICVKEQCTPDPEFPTVSFPNPEEKNALDLSIETANLVGSNLVIANDPDADRFTAAFKLKNGDWRQLTGNEIGILFTEYIIQTQYIDKSNDLSNVYILNSTVSSQMIDSIASNMGFKFKDTLTGFKWIGNKAIELESKGYSVPFAYEEAIGFMFSTVHDKDGISALIVFLQLYDRLLRDGIDPLEKLEQMYTKYGNFKQCNGYYITPDATTLPFIFNHVIRVKNVGINNNKYYPSHIGKYKVIYWRDLTTGCDSSTPDNKPDLYVDETSQMITCKVISESCTDKDREFVRFTARGSGTEPKLKVYIEAKAATEKKSQDLADDLWRTLREEWFEPEKNHLVERLV